MYGGGVDTGVTGTAVPGIGVTEDAGTGVGASVATAVVGCGAEVVGATVSGHWRKLLDAGVSFVLQKRQMSLKHPTTGLYTHEMSVITLMPLSWSPGEAFSEHAMPPTLA